MVAITEDEIRELAGFRATKAPVTTCYLDVDGARHVRHQDVVRELDRVVRPARARANGDQSVAKDLSRIEAHVRGGFDRSRTRGLAFFSCAAEDYWRVVELPVPVRSQVVTNHTPTVRQLEVVVDQHERFGLLLVDRQRIRIYVFELGEVVESTEQVDQLPRGDDDDHSFTKRPCRRPRPPAPAPGRGRRLFRLPGPGVRAAGDRCPRRPGFRARIGVAPLPA
jgi:peptide chain release factor subunit 1